MMQQESNKENEKGRAFRSVERKETALDESDLREVTVCNAGPDVGWDKTLDHKRFLHSGALHETDAY